MNTKANIALEVSLDNVSSGRIGSELNYRTMLGNHDSAQGNRISQDALHTHN
jgi:hypothetical protein